MPAFLSRWRTARANPSSRVSEMSKYPILVGSILPPAPMEEITGMRLARQCMITAILGATVSIASITKSASVPIRAAAFSGVTNSLTAVTDISGFISRQRCAKSDTFGSPTVERKVDRASASQDFAAGDTVSHKTFGTGTVISVAGDMIEVQFEKTGQTKKLMKGFAPIVKLNA